MRCLLFVSILLALFSGCDTNRSFSSDDLKAFILDPENGLRKTIESPNEIKLEMLYKPKDLILDEERDDSEAWTKSSITLDSLDYFVFSISRKNQAVENRYAGNPEKFNAAIQYLSEGIKNDISLVGASIFPVEGLMYVPTYGASESTNILIVFKSQISKQGGKLSIIFKDSVFGSGRSEFVFDSDDIRNTPSLHL